MNVLIACEESGTVRDAFIKHGHDAWSCDLQPTRSPGPHYQCDVREVLGRAWDMVIAHPPCTDLCVSGDRHFAAKRADGRQQASIEFFMLFTRLDHVPMTVIEQPVSIMSTLYRKPDQTIQPWMFGHGETKATCLWLKGLPLLERTHRTDDLFCDAEPCERVARIHMMPPSPDRARLRSTTYQGIADAMAEQWGRFT